MALKGAKKKWADDHVGEPTTLLVDDKPVEGKVIGWKELGDDDAEIEFTFEAAGEELDGKRFTFTAIVPSTDAEVKKRAEARRKEIEAEREERRKAALEAEVADSEDS